MSNEIDILIGSWWRHRVDEGRQESNHRSSIEHKLKIFWNDQPSERQKIETNLSAFRVYKEVVPIIGDDKASRLIYQIYNIHPQIELNPRPIGDTTG